MALRLLAKLLDFIRDGALAELPRPLLVRTFEEQEFARAARLGFQPIAVRVRDDRDR